MLTPDDFAAKIKEKYPEYKDVDNVKLSKAIIEKYPEYKSQVDFGGSPIDSVTDSRPAAERMGFVRRAALASKEAFMGGVDNLGAGTTLIKGGSAQIDQTSAWVAKAEDRFKRGEIDQAKLDEIKAFARDSNDRAMDLKNQGAAKTIRGVTELAVSPGAGVVEAAVAPIVEKAVNALPESGKQVVGGIAQKVDELGQQYPATRDILAAAGNVAAFTGAAKTAEAASKVAAKVAKKTSLETAGLAGDLPKILAENYPKVSPRQLEKRAEKVAQILTPDTSKKNYREAVAKGLAEPGQKRFLRGDIPSKIQLDGEMVEAAKVVARNIERAADIIPERLPTAIDKVIKDIAVPLRKAFGEIKVPIEVKKKVDDVWNSVKLQQNKNPRLSTVSVKSFQKEFETDYLGKIKQVWETPEGFRNTSVEDLWDLVIAYDKDWSVNVKNLAKEVDGIQDAQRAIWLQNRKILRDTMDSLADTIPDSKAREAFKEMSLLYKAKSAALDNVKPITKPRSGLLKTVAIGTLGSGVIGGTIAKVAGQ